MIQMIFLLLLVATLVSLGTSFKTNNKTSFQQLWSDQRFYSESATGAQRVLPLKNSILDTIYDTNGFCFVTLSSDGLIWSARQIIPEKEEMYNNGYDEFVLVYDFNDFLQANPSVVESERDEKVQKLVKTANSVLILTTSRVVEVVMDYKCSSFASITEQLQTKSKDIPGVWGEVLAVTTSDSGFWMGTSVAGILQVNFEKPMWKVVSLKQFLPNISDNLCSSLEYASSWNTLFIGTTSAFYALHFLPTGRSTDTDTDTDAAAPLVPAYMTHEWVGSVIDSAAIAMQYDCQSNLLWVMDYQTLHWLDSDGLWWREGHYQGSVTNNLTVLAPACTVAAKESHGVECFVWMGTDHTGLMRRRYPDTAHVRHTETRMPAPNGEVDWSLLNGPRFLPKSGNVLQLVADSTPTCTATATKSTTVLAITDFGVSFISTSPLRLSEKADVMLSARGRHDREGITTDTSLDTYADPETYSFHPEDSDSIWTGQYAVASAMRFHVTGSEKDRADAWHTFEAMERLATVTGTRGYVARTLCSPTERRGGGDHPTIGCGVGGEGGWEDSTAFPVDNDGTGWVWKGDTSSDTVTGHYFAYSVFYDLVADTAEDKARVGALITDITDYIVDNDFFYMDPVTGEPTLWGLWNPDTLNNDPERYGERGGNSLEMLSYLAISYSITGDKKYMESFKFLASDKDVRMSPNSTVEVTEGGGYYRNVLSCKIDDPDEDNHSDNQLDFMAYHTLFYAFYRVDQQLNQLKEKAKFELNGERVDDLKDLTVRHRNLKQMVTPVLPSVQRWWSIVKREHSPLWIALVAGAAGFKVSDWDTKQAIQVLQDYPLDLLDWGIKNSGRWDVKQQPYGDRGDAETLLMQEVRPAYERIVSHYNLNPFKMDSSNDPSVDLFSIGGTSELAPTEWLLPYYMMVFYDLI